MSSVPSPALTLLCCLACARPSETGAPPGDDSGVHSDPPESRAPDTGVELVPGDDGPETLDPSPDLFDPPHGLYDAPLTLSLSTDIADAEIRYTLDGRDPSGYDGLSYTGPLEIASTTVVRAAVLVDGRLVQGPVAQTYLFAAEVPSQAAPSDWPSQWWTEAEGGPYPADYELDADITASAAWSAASPALFSDLPVLSLVVDPDDLFGENGIHEHPLERGADWERAASVELFDAEGALDLTVAAGVRIQGGAGRRPDRSPKKNFRLLFKDEYGPTELDYPVYADGEVQSFNTLVLRAGYNRAWVNWQDVQRARSQYLHESFGQQLRRDQGGAAPRVRPVHLFLDGLYWGLYLIEERPDAAFLSSTLGGEREGWDALNSGEVVDGDSAAWEELLALAEEDLSDPANYSEISSILDIESFCDYMILNLALGNEDWPAKNWWAGRPRTEDGRWIFLTWDLELTMVELEGDYLDVADEDTPGELLQALRANEEFAVSFGDRAHRALANDGALVPEALAARWAELGAQIDPGVIAESARWGDHWRDARGEDTELYTYEGHWLPEHARVRDEHLPYRGAIFLAQLQEAGLYPTVTAPALSPFGGEIGPDEPVTLTGDGDLYYTLDGTDPREVGGGVAAGALLYTDALRLESAASLRARARTDEGWSALVAAEFTP